MLNRVSLMGRLTRDPELKRTSSGTAVVSFCLAVDRDFKDKSTGEKTADFIECVAWRQTAELISRYLSKGRMAVVEGRLQARTWKDKDGHSRKAVEVIVEHVYFADSSRRDTDSPATYAQPSAGDFQEINDDDGEFPF